MTGSKLARRGFTAFVALLCAASVAYVIHVNGVVAKAVPRARGLKQWERYARTTLAHRKQTTASLQLLVRRYNRLARSATTEQRRLLASLSRTRQAAESAKPDGAPPVTYRGTKSILISQPAIQQPAAVSAAPVAPSEATTKTSSPHRRRSILDSAGRPRNPGS